MTLAYIITAYKDPVHLRRLIDSLNYNSYFFIHIDSKISILPFNELLEEYNNVHFCENRFFTNWGSFAQVLSQKELLRCVFESNICFDRVICISGTDYPIWSNKKIFEEFKSNSKKQYIQGINLNLLNHPNQTKRVTLFHFFRDVKVNRVLTKKILSGSVRMLFMLLPIRKLSKTSLEGRLVDIYMGSDYWSLTIDCARYVYEKMCFEKDLMRYFRYSFVPSEMCVQTIVFNSIYTLNTIKSDNVIYKGLSTVTPLHYIEYDSTVRVFREQDYDILINSNKMFFRKALTGISDLLLNKIDLIRMRNENTHNS